MKVSSYIADRLAALSPRVYGVCGAGAMHLNDAIAHHPGLRWLPMHHEQAAAFAAEADARVSGKPGIVHVTAGPGGTNALTGVASAFVDSIPMIVIGGQASASTLKHAELRQLGMNELDVTATMRAVTKYAETVTDPSMVKFHLDKAIHLATTGRQGPVFLDFPIDVQGAQLPAQVEWDGPESRGPADYSYICGEFLKLLRDAARPVLIVGNGVRLAGARDEIRALADRLCFPVVTSWNAIDLMAQHPCVVGRMGIFGDRAGNLAVQNADLIIAIGTRLSFPQTGHAPQLFAPNAKRVIVDIDPQEASKRHLHADMAIEADAKHFLADLLDVTLNLSFLTAHRSEWMAKCREWRKAYPVVLPEYRADVGLNPGVDSYAFAEQLAQHAPDDAIIVTDVGYAYITLMQALKLKRGQRLFHSGGVSAMGYGLPAAIGACLAGEGRPVICVTGDGGLMLNLQELQTIVQHQLPISIFVMANDGYKTIRLMQDNHFKRESAAGPDSGVSCPDFTKVAEAFGIPTWSAYCNDDVSSWIEHLTTRGHPILCQMHMRRDQVIAPRVQTRMEGNKFVLSGLDDMWPYLEREEHARNMATEAAAWV